MEIEVHDLERRRPFYLQAKVVAMRRRLLNRYVCMREGEFGVIVSKS